MNKCSPEKLKDAADDLQGWLHRHQDVVRVEPEITRMVPRQAIKPTRSGPESHEDGRKSAAVNLFNSLHVGTCGQRFRFVGKDRDGQARNSEICGNAGI